jgi:hypothetical protein
MNLATTPAKGPLFSISIQEIFEHAQSIHFIGTLQRKTAVNVADKLRHSSFL